ncbi:MAG: class A beta-lactamase-related serine hydrolase [Cytophagales bacterium]|nr:MAG: class A beta-lactamase-related serine hydrolase [Cytophagales bacterium]
MYLPPIGSSSWESSTPESLGWNTSEIAALTNYLNTTNSRAFIVLKDGKIVMEYYFGKNFNGGSFTQNDLWYWASAGKTLTATMVGIAQQEGLLSLQEPSSRYMGTGWTNLAADQEIKITVWNQITMTTGLDDGVADPDCTDKNCLVQKAEAGKRWAYHNAPYTLLDKVIEGATKQSFSVYFNTKIRDKIGMEGIWIKSGYNNVFYSTARSMARFGLLVLNKGKWGENTILNENYYNAMIQTSQTLNTSYGYLWWLNGKSSFMVPTLQTVFSGSIAPNAPSDMIAAMGKNGQLINVVPSKNIVVIRMGDVPDNSLVPFTYQDEIWKYLNKIIK